MANSDPIIEQIAQDIEETLRGVRKQAGFQIDLAVERTVPDREGVGPPEGVEPGDSHYRCYLFQDEPYEDASAPQQHLAWMMPFVVQVFIVEPQTSDVPVDRRMNIIAADVFRALRADRHRSGLANDTVVPPYRQIVNEAGEFEGIEYIVEIKYRHLQDDPYRR